MKTIGASLQTHLASEVATVAICFKITTPSAIILTFTSHTEDVVVSGVRYTSVNGLSPTAIDTTGSLAVDNLDARGFLHTLGLTNADIHAGKYDGSTLEVFLVNYADTSMGVVKLRKGFLGNMRWGRVSFDAEVRGIMERYTKELCELYTPSCRADLGDARCTVDLTPFTFTGTITSLTNNRKFKDSSRTEATGYFLGGKLTWTGGLNSGLAMEVKNWTLGSTEFELMLPMPYTVQVGDTYSVHKGCVKTLAMCRDDFNNIENFRGEPYVPQTVTMAISALK